jgi:hypothetical protein
MLKRFLTFIVVGVAVETLAFAYVHADALALTTGWPFWETRADLFEQRADRLLRGHPVTRKEVEAIATQARVLDDPALEARALGMFSDKEPTDRNLRLRYADALRRAGKLQDARRVYTDLLAESSTGGQ